MQQIRKKQSLQHDSILHSWELWLRNKKNFRKNERKWWNISKNQEQIQTFDD